MTKLVTGETIKTTVGALTLDERVLYEPSAYQYDTGWWAFDADGKEYFVSDDGIVYGNGDQEEYNVVVGRVAS